MKDGAEGGASVHSSHSWYSIKWIRQPGFPDGVKQLVYKNEVHYLFHKDEMLSIVASVVRVSIKSRINVCCFSRFLKDTVSVKNSSTLLISDLKEQPSFFT